MRRKAKLILPLALVIVIAIVAVSMADGGGDGKSQTKAGWTSYAPLADRDQARRPTTLTSWVWRNG